MAQARSVLAIFGVMIAFQASADMELTFSPMSEWDKKRFEGETDYQTMLDTELNTSVLYGRSDASASGLIQEIDIDLTETPWVSWYWKVVESPNVTDESVKAQDDFAWRIGVTVTPGLTMMSSETIIYVWSPNKPHNSFWGNPFSPGSFKMLAANIGDKKGEWQYVSRNVREDFQRVFGENYRTLSAVSIMSDSDNSKSQSAAYVSPIRFSSSSIPPLKFP
ncbi:DUF3047 domain-containing protein [Enterovibrio calviensis]|uniref:DUF3047 domain-containing protein n=1 Tax=Enterovibrio calviensis TaxID=91359 RepID=UPI00054D6A34|nr:DUF3047 domain-containing protein [Enterovibrio calviensis]